MRRMGWFVNSYLAEKKGLQVLDVGSYDVNGSYKKLFIDKGHNYKGLDMEEGPNVDIKPNSPYKWDEVETDKFDIVVSGQAMEHIEFFWITISEMVRVTKEGGIICLIAPAGFKEHRYPVDCWRFFTDGMVAIARYYELEILHAHSNAAPNVGEKEWYSEDCADTMLIAKKAYRGKARICNLDNYKCNPAKHKELREHMVTYEEHKKHEEMNRDTKARPAKESFIRKIYRKMKDTIANMGTIKKR